MSPFFNCKSLSSYRIKISNATETMIKTIENKLKVKKRCSVDIVPLLTRLLAEIHLQAFLSFDSEKNPRNVDEFISTQLEWTKLRHLRNKTWYLYPDFVYYLTPYGIKDFFLVRRMRSLASVWLDSKEKNRNTDHNSDIKNAVINKYGQRVTDADIGLVDSSRSILSATCMVLFYLAKYPLYQKIVRHEVNDLFDGNEIRTNLEEKDFSKLLNTMMFLKEVLRKHPPTTTADRQITEDVEVDGIKFPKGTYFQIDIYGLHHNEALWDKPEEFRPERFADAPKPQSTDGFKFLPFMAYSRDCIAKQFSIEEIIIILAKIVQRFDIECDEHYVMSNETITHVPENGVRVYFKLIHVE